MPGTSAGRRSTAVNWSECAPVRSAAVTVASSLPSTYLLAPACARAVTWDRPDALTDEKRSSD
jgi:hypothetical protein